MRVVALRDRSGGFSLVQRHRAGIPHARPEAEDRLHAGHHRHLPAGCPRADALRRLPERSAVPGPIGRDRGSSVPGQPVLGWRVAAVVDLRARRHAVHHRDDHRAVAPRGHPALRDPLQRRSGGSGEAHAVHALSDDRPRAAAVDHAGDGRALGSALRFRRRARMPAAADERHLVGAAAHDHHDDRRYGPGHVVRRAGHRARRGQRHVHPHLHLDRRHLSPAPCSRS
ncbi:hypothetical protein QE410_002757 [Microbacterium sp. SORGH_AS 1204]|nr:hypothetical protein [Microbacterium sp. SORGH_AS_1204]